MFKPHLWGATKVSWASTLCDKKIDTLVRNKCWIRSLTVDVEHVEKPSIMGIFTALQELVFSDESTKCRGLGYGVVNVNSHCSQIETQALARSRLFLVERLRRCARTVPVAAIGVSPSPQNGQTPVSAGGERLERVQSRVAGGPGSALEVYVYQGSGRCACRDFHFLLAAKAKSDVTAE
ncbi:MAG: hypothetical protein BYD32DRAFT_438509 [Podila humilis]|nr:MAG: hypothetical protein BYD32DRAFT_438509 [Podila humilis]